MGIKWRYVMEDEKQAYNFASTLTKVYSLRSNIQQRFGFTLAEVLITLGIIGVVAVIVMPAVITNIQGHVKAERVNNIQHKFSKSMDTMRTSSGLTGYNSTMDLVTELQKYLKLAKVCDNNDLKSCWPTDKVILENGKEWEISKTKQGKHLKMMNLDGQEWDDTVGIITADGTPMILSYNKQCSIDENKSITWSGSNSSSNGCIAAVFDWNGARNPNKFREDVIAFNANGLGSSCAVEVEGTCFSAPFTPTPVTKAECEELKDSLGILYYCNSDSDYWVGAVKQCGGRQNMPTVGMLSKLAKYLYNTNRLKEFDLTLDTSKVASAGLSDEFIIWSNAIQAAEHNSIPNAFARYYYSEGTVSQKPTTDTSSIQAVCLVD